METSLPAAFLHFSKSPANRGWICWNSMSVSSLIRLVPYCHDDTRDVFAVAFMFFQPRSKLRESEGHRNTFSLFCLFAFINMSFLHLPAKNILSS